MRDKRRTLCLKKGGRWQKLAGLGNPLRLTYVSTEEVSHAKSYRQFSVRAAAVPVVTGFYRCGCTDAGPGNRRDNSDFYANPRGNAAFFAGVRSWEALQGWRWRRLLRRGRPTRPMGNVFLRFVPAAEDTDS